MKKNPHPETETAAVSKRKKTDAKADAGRAANGRFTRGCAAGPGRPAGRTSVESWRRAFAEAITAADLRAVARSLVTAARAGEKWAVTELLDRCIGSLAEVAIEERLNELEAALAAEAT